MISGLGRRSFAGEYGFSFDVVSGIGGEAPQN